MIIARAKPVLTRAQHFCAVCNTVHLAGTLLVKIDTVSSGYPKRWLSKYYCPPCWKAFDSVQQSLTK